MCVNREADGPGDMSRRQGALRAAYGGGPRQHAATRGRGQATRTAALRGEGE